ncbi:hypothetical protein AB0425_41435 [Actinosynnema sp. NPDC051121]
MSPQIPAMPPPPPVDAGQGPHGSQPWYSRGDDLAFLDTAVKMKIAAAAGGLPNASRHLSHYLSNTGEDLTLDPDEILGDEPGLKALVDRLVSDVVRRIAGGAASNGGYDAPIPFQSEWYGYTFANTDWFLAIGAVHASATGVVTVHAPNPEGATPHITLDCRSHLFDRYNWDGDKKTTIAGMTFTDRELGGLHTAGLAKEFTMYGSSEVKHYQGVLPISAPLDLPTPPGRPGR